MVRNPHHTFGPSWARNQGPAYLNSVTFVPIPSDTTAVSELLAGQVDVSDVSGGELSRVQGNTNFTLHRSLTQILFYLMFNTGKAPFNNAAVRRAVAEAIDRKAMVATAAQGLGKVATSALSPAIYDYDAGSAKYVPKLDLAAARAAIAAAHATGPYTLLSVSLYNLNTAAELVQAALAQVGMQVNIVNPALAQYQSDLNGGNFDLALGGYTYTDPDVLYLFFHSSQIGGGLNWLDVRDPTLDKLLNDGRNNLNLKKAKADYYAAQKLIITKAYIDPLWIPISVVAVRNKIQGFHAPYGAVLDQGVWQDVWIK
jgi:peptide/nickel transport system substrate-binding protein